MKKYYKLISKSHKINSKLKKLGNMSIVEYLASKIANIFIPIFLILKTSPTKISTINIFLSLLILVLINISEGKFFGYALVAYLFCRILDHVDGGVARIIKGKTFFGRFVDSMNDALLLPLLYLSLSFYCFNLTENYILFIIGTITPLFLLMQILILDKFSALVRWSNVENKKNFPSYIRKKIFLRFFLVLEDTISLGILMLFIFKSSVVAIQIIFGLICFSVLFSSITNLIIHSYYAHQYLSFKKK